MRERMKIDLAGRVAGAPNLTLDRIEWWTAGSRFVVLRYTMNGEMPELGIRIDLDKQVVLDVLDGKLAQILSKEKVEQICEIVIAERDDLNRSNFQERQVVA